MEIAEFLNANRQFQSIELWYFPNTPPQYLVLSPAAASKVRIQCSMRQITPRAELGILLIELAPESTPIEADVRSLCGPVRLCSYQTLAAPNSDVISGLIMNLDVGELTLTAGAMPYTLFVRKGTSDFGSPEYPLDQYRSRAN
jgi:hypothetical protein